MNSRSESGSGGYKLLSVDVTAQCTEQLEERLLDAGALSCTLEDADENPLLEPEPGETPLWPRIKLTAMFDSATDSQLLTELANSVSGFIDPASVRISELPEQSWERAWMVDFKPVQISPNFWILPSFSEAPDPDAINLVIDPGLAFGSGTHSTTLLCLQWLANQSLSGRSVLDFGCGSGILSIAAAMLGASSVTAIDIDPQAVDATLVNARRNGVEDKVIVLDDENKIDTSFDFLVANILLAPILQRCDRFHDLLHDDGHLALSGVLADQTDELSVVYNRCFAASSVNRHEDWVLYTAQKQSPANGAPGQC